MKKKTALILAAAAAVAAAVLIAIILKTAGGNLDVVGRQSVTSFNAVLEAIPNQVSADEANGGWSLLAPDGTARFIWSKDSSNSPMHDVMLELDATPFVNAGLDTGRLTGNYTSYDGMLMVGTRLGSEEFQYSGAVTPLASYEQIVNRYRSAINYHTALDHYGVKLGGGSMFEWAKDLKRNTVNGNDQDKDMVFVLNPEPLIAAGVDPTQVEGWIYAQVSADENGKTVLVYRFLKPFNIV